MPSPPKFLGPPLPRRAGGDPAAVVVLAAHFLIALAAVRQKSNTDDEIAHVTAGVSDWRENDYRVHFENGILPQRWFALPWLTLGLHLPCDSVLWMEETGLAR